MELQAQILRRFLAQFAGKEVTSAYEDGAYAVEFMKLKRQSTKYRADKTYSTKAADKQDNSKKNRYKDIVPFDHSRVKLSLNTSKNDTDYINANFIRGVWSPIEYIATQGPLPHTVLDFWRMLWEYNVQVIVMACREFEMGRKKCERYWPETMVDVFVCEAFAIHCESEENKGDYLIRTLRVTYNNSSRTLKQLHYMNWPDHGVPDSIPPILEMLQDMRMFQEQDDVPICIHCSAGCGRTGALCVIDYTWNLLKKQMIPEDFDIYNLVQDMRTQRPSIVQTKEQYILVYRVIKFLFENHLQIMESNSNSKEVLAAPPLIPVDSDNEISDFNDTEEQPEPGEGNRLYPCYYLRCPENTEVSNHVAPSAGSQPLRSHLRPHSPLGPKRTPADVLNDMKNWVKSNISPRDTTPSQLHTKTDLGHQKPNTPRLAPLQETDLGHHKFQILEPPILQQAVLGYQKSQILEPPKLQPLDYGHQKPQILEPPPLQPTNHRHQKSQIPKPPRLHKADLGCRKSQTLETPSLQETDLEYKKSQILEPPLLQLIDIGYQKSQIPDSLPLQQTDFGQQMPQILKPPRSQKADPGCHEPQVPETTNQTQQTLNSSNPVRPTAVQESSHVNVMYQAELNNNGALFQAPSICLTVEDPYFGPDSTMSIGSVCTERAPLSPCPLKTQSIELPIQDKSTGVTTCTSDEDSPPPLPDRTPESYILANEVVTPEPPQILTSTLLQCTMDLTLLNATDMTGMDDKGDKSDKDETSEMVNGLGVDQSLMLVIPSDTFSINGGGSPSSPAPPLPERTPESFILADNEDLLRNAVQEKPQETVLRVGKSSEWSGNSNLDVPDFKRSWSRSKSLKSRLSLNVPVSFQPFVPFHLPIQEPPKSLTPPLPERTSDSFLMGVPASETPSPLTPPLPRRTPGSYTTVREDGMMKSSPSNSALCQSDSVQLTQRSSTSSEWSLNSQPKTLLEVMTRSKSVKVKSSKQECLAVVPQPDPDNGATAESVFSTAVEQTPVSNRQPAVEQPEKTSISKKCRTKSLRLWKGKQKTKEAPASASSNRGAAAGFIFSFGTRFGKPKGPRSQPETWV